MSLHVTASTLAERGEHQVHILFFNIYGLLRGPKVVSQSFECCLSLIEKAYANPAVSTGERGMHAKLKK